MTRQTHLIVGAALGVLLARQYGLMELPALALIIATPIAAVLPDVDLRVGLKHRGITHTLLALLLLALLCWSVAPALLLCVVGGYASHLLLDALTVSGIPLLYPLMRWRFRLARLRTGGTVDQLIAVGAALLMFIAVLHDPVIAKFVRAAFDHGDCGGCL